MSPSRYRGLDAGQILATIRSVKRRIDSRFPDHVVIGAVNEIEGLASGLMDKIWQKIMILDRMAQGA